MNRTLCMNIRRLGWLTATLALGIVPAVELRAEDPAAGGRSDPFKAVETFFWAQAPRLIGAEAGGNNPYQASGNVFYQPQKVTGSVGDQLQTDFVTIEYPADSTLGATLEPVDDSLRAQLSLPPDQGVIVASLAGEGPAARAGLEEKDILLSLADKPLGRPDDLTQELEAAGKSAVTLKLLRRGKPVTLQVRPVFRVTLAAAGKEPASDYYIGVMLNPPDDALRAHLDLPEGKGLIANQVVPGSPAEKAGVKLHDILLELGGKPIESPESLIAQVQASKGKSTTLKLLRAGKPLSIEITPELRPAGDDPHRRETLHFYQVHPPQGFTRFGYGVDPANRFWGLAGPQPRTPDSTDQRLEALDQQLKALSEAVNELRKAIDKQR